VRPIRHVARRIGLALASWFDASVSIPRRQDPRPQIAWLRHFPFVAMHLGCFAVFSVGVGATAVTTAVVMYVIRMFAITAFYHRYFSHRAFRTSRLLQWFFAVVGNSAAQRGPLWWAAHHRLHHRHSDEAEDLHSPIRHGFFWSHFLWFANQGAERIDLRRIKDLSKYPELVFLDRYYSLVPILTGAGLFALGTILGRLAPALETNGPQLFVWGFLVSTVCVYHGTFSVNSIAHLFGTRAYDTGDNSRNNFLLAIVTLGEGWHNNHHHFPSSVRQGHVWWQIDMTYYVLAAMARLGLIWDLRDHSARPRSAEQPRASAPSPPSTAHAFLPSTGRRST
jgi:stearoyl-CoA desaturase (Delta-9 desaturase)